MNAQHRRSDLRRRLLGAAAGLAATALVAVALPASAGATTSPVPRRIVSGWGYFNSTSSTSLTGLAANADLFTDVSPFWYTARWSGSSSSIAAASYAANKASVLPAIRATGVKVLPTITDGMPAHRMAAVLNGTTTRANLVAQIAAVVTANGYDGIDLDFEGFAFNDGSSTWASTRPGWVAFVKQLYVALHATGKQLSITVPAGGATSSDSTGYSVYAWSLIGPYVDRLRIMAYDYSPSTPGPISPFAWVQRVVAFAVTQVAPGKIQIGVPTYGRDWYTGTVGSCPTLAPAGVSSAQGSAFFNDLAWAKGRYAYTSQRASSWVSGLFSSGAPGVSFAEQPVVTLDPNEHESTFGYRVSFTGRVQPPVVRTVAVGANAGATTVLVSSVAGIYAGMTVTGAGIAPATTVTAASAVPGPTVTLSALTTADVTGALTFTAAPVATTIAVPAPVGTTALTVPLPAAAAIHPGDLVGGDPALDGTVVQSVDTTTGVVTFVAPIGTAMVGTAVTFQTPPASPTAVGGPPGGSTVLVSSVSGVAIGSTITGAGLAAGTTVTAVAGNVLTLSQPISATPALTGPLVITPPAAVQTCTVSRVGWYADASSAVATATLVAQYQLQGIVQWTLGGEDLGQWSLLRGYARTIAPTPAVASIAVPAIVPYGTHPSVVVTTTSAGVRVAGAPVTLFFRAPKAKTWTRLATVVSSASGTARFTPPVTATGTFRAYVGGTYDRLPAVVMRPVALGTYVLVTAPKTPVKAGARTTIGIHLLPRHLGQVVVLQVLKSKKWVTVATKKTDKLGRTGFAVIPVGSKAKNSYRVLVAAVPGVAAAKAYATITTR